MKKSYYEMVVPFTQAAMLATKKIAPPTVPTRLDIPGRRFIFDMVCSEAGELVIADTIVDEIDALLDIAYYCVDSGIRHGHGVSWSVELQDKCFGALVKPMEKEKVATKLITLNTSLLKATTIAAQNNALHTLINYCNLQINLLGYPMEPLFEAVANANNRKIVNGEVKVNKQGKVLKPTGWVGPEQDIALILEKYSA